MSSYKQMWEGQWGWYNALMFSMMGLMMVFFFIPVQYKIWMLPGTIIYLLGFWGVQNKVMLNKKNQIEGNRFIDARIVRGKDYSEEILLGFAKFQRLNLGNNDRTIEQMEFYQKIKDEIISDIIAERHADELENQASFNAFSSPSEEKKETDKKEPEKIEVGYDIIQLSEAEIKLAQKREAEFLKYVEENNIFVYLGTLYEPECFSDSPEHKFSQCAIICSQELEKEFLFSKLDLVVDGYDVCAQAAKASMSVWAWIGDAFPVFHVDHTERHQVNKLDHVINANMLQTIKEKIMEKWIFSKQNFFQRFEMQLRQKDVKYTEVFKIYTALVQDIEDQKIDNIFEDPNESSKSIKISKKLYIGFISISCSAVILLGILFGVVI